MSKKALRFLKGLYLIDIYEDAGEIVSRDKEWSTFMLFDIHIRCSYKPVLHELRKTNVLFKKLPKDIFNIILEKLNDFDFVFQRENESNGYYQGYLDITMNDA